jgi:hypothetical protein
MIGQIISHYCVVEKLGGGGMGVAYTPEEAKGIKRRVESVGLWRDSRNLRRP